MAQITNPQAYIILLLATFTLASCSMPKTDTRIDLLAALNNLPDGSTGVVAATGEQFEIISTKSDGTRLCRVVSLEKFRSFQVESFCKIRGGQWR